MTAPTTSTVYAYIGSYAEAEDPSVYACAFDAETGRLTLLQQTSGLINPTFLAIDPVRRTLLAIAEDRGPAGERLGAAVAYAIDERTGELTFRNRQATVAASTCHIMLDHSRRSFAVASYSGSRIGLSRMEDDGSAGPATDTHMHEGSGIRPQQDKPHPHSVFFDPANRFALVPDLGIDRIVVYRLDLEQLKLVPHGETAVAAGAGPRHFVFHPTAPYGYVINELNSTVTAFVYDGDLGRLTEIESVTTLPSGYEGNNATADIHISPDGRFLYGSNRGHDSIVVYAIDAATGRLSLIEHVSSGGGHPRNFGLSPDGRFLLAANRDSDNVVTFARDAATGKLQPTGDELRVSKPVCVKFFNVN
ncbi:lactonase family protein [Paenibacillus sp. HJGM_3]|uniref:lactonase family protein n=1 Tax=Paenibacillus sp. HJGM_3 TaxID=3379816 RepID=UPI00385EF242